MLQQPLESGLNAVPEVPCEPSTSLESNQAVLPPEARELPATALAVNYLKTHSGLSWKELARVLGVGQRTVFAWTQGARMNQSHIDLLKKLTTIVDEIATASPEATRIVLFTPGADGFSPYQAMLRELEIPGRVREGFTVEQLLGGAD